MKDKEKQIEEMAREIFDTCAWRFGKPNDYKEIFNDIAEDLIKLNYLKIDKDSVVLSREEYESDLTLQYDTGYEFGSKETAEKIILFIKNYTTKLFHEYHKVRDVAENDYKKCKEEMGKAILNNDWHRCDAIMFMLETISIEIEELAKQYGIEIKE